MEAVKDSFGKTFAEQQALLLADEEVPMARTVVMGMVVHYLATGQRLYPNCWVRCRDTATSVYRVGVGGFHSGGFGVGGYWDGDRPDYLGLAASRKF